MLLVELTDGSKDLRYFCQACPYVYTITSKVTKDAPLQKKEVDDVLGGADAWKNAPKTDVNCPRCSYHKAAYMEIQIRSADEPATIFYRCMECEHQWREG